MRNSQLHVKNLFGIGDLDLNFPGHGLIAIQGENGAGKSSILDSLSVAMFGEPTPARSVKNADILSRGADDGEVSLLFEWKGKKYRIERQFKRGRKDAVNHKAFLYSVKADGTEEGLATGPDAVSEEVSRVISGGTIAREGSELIRIVKSAWLSSVFLPQGEITRLLKMKPAERREIISALFGLEEGGVLKERSKALFALADAEMKALDADERSLAASLAEHPLESVKEATERMKELSALIASIEKTSALLGERVEIMSELEKIAFGKEQAAERLEKNAVALQQLEYGFRLSEAKTYLEAIRIGGRRSADLIQNIKTLEGEGERAVRVFQALTEEVQKLLPSRAALEKELKEARQEASSAPVVRAIRELRFALEELNASVKAKMDLYKSRIKEGQVLSVLLAEKVVMEQKASVEAAEKNALTLGDRVKTLGDSLKETLVKWISVLSGGEEVLSVEDVRNMDTVLFARTMESAGFSALLTEMGRRSGEAEGAKKTLEERKRVLEEAELEAEKMAEIRKTLPEMLFSQYSSRYGSLATEQMQREKERLSRECSAGEGEIKGLLSTVSGLKEKGMTMKKSLGPDVNEDKCIEAQARAGILEGRLSEAVSEIEKAETKRSRAEVEMTAVQGKINSAQNSLASLREREREHFSNWKKCVNGWVHGDFQAMHALPEPISAAKLEGARQEKISLERSLKDMANREGVLRKDRKFPVSREDITKELSEAKTRLCKLDGERIESVSLCAGLKKDIESYRSLSMRLRNTRENKKMVLPAYDKARTVSKLLEGNGFGNFLQDRALSVLLDFVNTGLASSKRYRGYSFTSSGGSIAVTDESGTRDAASLSGGEATMATLLLLRGMQSVSGIGGMMAIDEGFAQLDTRNLSDAVSVLSSLSEENLIIAITHDPDFAREFDTVWSIGKGGVVETVVNNLKISENVFMPQI